MNLGSRSSFKFRTIARLKKGGVIPNPSSLIVILLIPPTESVEGVFIQIMELSGDQRWGRGELGQ